MVVTPRAGVGQTIGPGIFWPTPALHHICRHGGCMVKSVDEVGGLWHAYVSFALVLRAFVFVIRPSDSSPPGKRHVRQMAIPPLVTP